MAETNQLNYGWLVNLSNPNHDGITQQIDDAVQAYQSDNSVFNQKKAALHTARQQEDNVWLTSQRDPVVVLLEKADKTQDSYVGAARYIITAHAGLPETEPTQAEAAACLQVFTDYKFRTDNSYGAEADKIIQMQQNFEPHQAFLTQIGAWTFYLKASEQAQLVRQYLAERAKTMGQFVKGEMKTARTQTDQAIAELYKVITAMMELMPSAGLSALYNQLKGFELYAKQYNIKGGSGSSSNSNGSSSSGSSSGSATDGGSTSGGSTDETGGSDSGSGSSSDTGGSDNTGGSTGGSGSDDDGGDVNAGFDVG